MDPTLLKGKDLNMLPESEVMSRLTAVDGLGNWSAHMFLIHKLQRQNVIAVGDLGVKKGIAKMYGLSDSSWKKMKEAQFLELVQHWQPYGSLGSALMWKADEVVGEEFTTSPKKPKKSKKGEEASSVESIPTDTAQPPGKTSSRKRMDTNRK